VMWTAELWSGVRWERQLGDVDSRIMERCSLGERELGDVDSRNMERCLLGERDG
jgi:hypothetical protein